LACGDQRRLTGNGSESEVVFHDFTFTFTTMDACIASSVSLMVITAATNAEILSAGAYLPPTAISTHLSHVILAVS